MHSPPFSLMTDVSGGAAVYTHRVQYYETDQMGFAHHSNFIRWMEEARIDFMDEIGYPYTRMEAEGVISPVRAVRCQYKHPCKFGDLVSIRVMVESFNGVVLVITYEMKLPTGEVACVGQSEHVFLNREGRIIRMKHDMPEFCAALEARNGV